MNKDEIISTFRNFMEDDGAVQVLDGYGGDNDVRLEKLGLNSLKMVEISMELEEKFGLDIDLEDFEGLKTLSEFIEYCRSIYVP